MNGPPSCLGRHFIKAYFLLYVLGSQDWKQEVFFFFSPILLQSTPTHPPLWPSRTSPSLLILGFVQAAAKLYSSNLDCSGHLLHVQSHLVVWANGHSV